MVRRRGETGGEKGEFFYIYFKRVHLFDRMNADGWTDGRMDGRTDGRDATKDTAALRQGHQM